MKARKKIFAGGFLLVLLLQAIGALTVCAYEIPKPTSEFYVNDFAEILEDDTEAYIVKINEALNEKTGAQVVVTTIKSLDGADLEEYATDLFRQYGIGSSDKNNGVLILLALEDRACRVEVGYGLEGALNDSKTGRIQDDYMIPYFRDEKWDEGMCNGFDAIVSEVATEYDVEIGNNDPVIKEEPVKEEVPWYRDDNTVGMISMGIALVVGLIMGALIPSFWIGMLTIALSPIIGHFALKCYLPEMDIIMHGMSVFGILISNLIGWAITTKTVDSGGSSGGGYSSGSSHSSRRSSGSSYSSGGSSHHGGGGRSGGGGSSRRF